jgi:serine/threonine-protein kinase ATR
MAQHIDWEDKSGNFRSWHRPVNWQEIYGSWKQHGFEVDACVQFGGLTPDKWKDLPADAYRYGKAFAEYFGPSGEHRLVTSVEIGNEPAGNKEFSPEGYKRIFEHMARGIRDGDPKLTILTATAEGVPPGGKSDGWSYSMDLFKDAAELYDVINIHKYALIQGWPTWERTYPEDTKVDYRGTVQHSIDWRDAHAPDKPVWITEFGYDASTKPAPTEGTFAKWKDSTDLQQAQWIVRSFLMFSEMDLGRAYLYWFNDGDTPSFHASSGVTRDFVPKPSYFAMRHLQQSLGDYRFNRSVRRDAEGPWVFEYVHGEDPAKLVYVAWSATGGDKEATATLALPGKATRAEGMPTVDGEATAVKIEQQPDGSAAVNLTESPVYVWVQR